MSFTYHFIDQKGSPIIETLEKGEYQFDLWGASGYDVNDVYSRGSHVSGRIKLFKAQTFYLNIGEMGKLNGPATYNGGGRGSKQSGYSGGGGTDIRLIGGHFSNFDSLLSRIIVAGGGGGFVKNSEFHDNCIIYHGNHSNGGTLIGGEGMIKRSGYNNKISVAKGGTQTKGGDCGVCLKICSHGKSTNGTFGIGGNPDVDWTGGGGGGYFGGGGGSVENYIIGSGGGGSSFVSGCLNCIAISPNSTSSNIIPMNSSIHYSGIIFSQIIMHHGAEKFLSPTGYNETGHFGHGCIKIRFLNKNIKQTCIQYIYMFNAIKLLTLVSSSSVLSL